MLFASSILLSLLWGSSTELPKVPFVYDKGYNIGCLGVEKLHPFDTAKYKKVAEFLKKEFGIKDQQFHKPKMVTDKELELVHSKEYLKSLQNPINVLKVAEMLPPEGKLRSLASWIPPRVLNYSVLNPMRLATGGTLLAAKLALKNKKAAVNIGGGYHHAGGAHHVYQDDSGYGCSVSRKKREGEGFCYFGDIQYAIKSLRKSGYPNLRAMIVDLDAHQGNGYEADFKDDKNVIAFDVYGEDNYPGDYDKTRQYITYNHPVSTWIGEKEYLEVVENNLGRAIEKSKPDIVFYNAGTDILEGDHVGHFSITKEGITKRDEIVFRDASRCKVPVCMVTSGGYTKESANAISSSLKNLIVKKYISLK